MKLIKFESTWCGACKKQDEYLKKVTQQTGVEVENINIENDVKFVTSLGIQTLPSTALLVGDKLIYVWQGLTQTQQIVNIIQDNQ